MFDVLRVRYDCLILQIRMSVIIFISVYIDSGLCPEGIYVCFCLLSFLSLWDKKMYRWVYYGTGT